MKCLFIYCVQYCMVMAGLMVFAGIRYATVCASKGCVIFGDFQFNSKDRFLKHIHYFSAILHENYRLKNDFVEIYLRIMRTSAWWAGL